MKEVEMGKNRRVVKGRVRHLAPLPVVVHAVEDFSLVFLAHLNYIGKLKTNTKPLSMWVFMARQVSILCCIQK